MNREIKFRAWRKNEMVEFELGEVLCDDRLKVLDFKDLPVMQYTGLKDKNGKEIYEGDVLRFHYFYQSLGANLGGQESEHELTGIVKWQQYGYGLSAIKGEHWRGYTGYEDGEGSSDFLLLAGMSESSIHEESFQILGNIYENADMLAKATT
jgi:uncharacterized phage protein (TIGR01671 family)